MGIAGMSPGSLLLIFLITAVLFGTRRLATIGEDLGKGLRGFRKGLNGDSPLSSTSLKAHTTDRAASESDKL